MKVGSLVVLVKPYEPHLVEFAKSIGSSIPKLNTIYEVTDIGHDADGVLCIQLEEHNPVIYKGERVCYVASRFREVQPPMDLTGMLKETETLTLTH